MGEGWEAECKVEHLRETRIVGLLLSAGIEWREEEMEDWSSQSGEAITTVMLTTQQIGLFNSNSFKM